MLSGAKNLGRSERAKLGADHYLGSSPTAELRTCCPTMPVARKRRLAGRTVKFMSGAVAMKPFIARRHVAARPYTSLHRAGVGKARDRLRSSAQYPDRSPTCAVQRKRRPEGSPLIEIVKMRAGA